MLHAVSRSVCKCLQVCASVCKWCKCVSVSVCVCKCVSVRCVCVQVCECVCVQVCVCVCVCVCVFHKGSQKGLGVSCEQTCASTREQLAKKGLFFPSLPGCVWQTISHHTHTHTPQPVGHCRTLCCSAPPYTDNKITLSLPLSRANRTRQTGHRTGRENQKNRSQEPDNLRMRMRQVTKTRQTGCKTGQVYTYSNIHTAVFKCGVSR